jgi:molybdopterin-biosynthesis enzyme MoeA-like protein
MKKKELEERIKALEDRMLSLEKKQGVMITTVPSILPTSTTVIKNLCSACGLVFNENMSYTCQTVGCPSLAHITYSRVTVTT